MADLFKAKKISCSSQCERKPTEEELSTRDMERLWIMTIMGLIDD